MTKMINKTTKLYAGDKFAITTTDGRKLRLVIEQDQFPEDPRSWDNLGTMLCCHREYQLGDCNSNRETKRFGSFSIKTMFADYHFTLLIIAEFRCKLIDSTLGTVRS